MLVFVRKFELVKIFVITNFVFVFHKSEHVLFENLAQPHRNAASGADFPQKIMRVFKKRHASALYL